MTAEDGPPEYASSLEGLRYVADQCAAIAPHLDAFNRGTRRQKLRMFVVVCESDHVLAEVFPTASGPHVLWKTGGLWGQVGEDVFRTRTALVYAAPADDMPDLVTVCRCGIREPIRSEVWAEWLRSNEIQSVPRFTHSV